MARKAGILKKFSVSVRGLKWGIELHSPESYETIDGAGTSDAMTDEEPRLIYFRVDKLNRIVIRHEIFHAFVASMHLNSASLTGEQMEEVCAEFLSTSVDEYLKVSDKLWAKMELLKP